MNRLAIYAGLLCAMVVPLGAGAQTSNATMDGSPVSTPDVTAQSGTGKVALVSPWGSKEIDYCFINGVGEEDRRITVMNQAGEDSSRVRWDYARMIGLQQDEATQMLNLTLNGYHAIKGEEKEQQDAVREYRQSPAFAQSRGIVQSAALDAFEQQRWGTVAETMSSLIAALGEESFTKLNKFIYNVYGPHDPSHGFGSVPPGTPQAPAPAAAQVQR